MQDFVSKKSLIADGETEGINETQDNEKLHSGRNFFSLKSSILALWVPCVIGKTKYSFLLISLTSF